MNTEISIVPISKKKLSVFNFQLWNRPLPFDQAANATTKFTASLCITKDADYCQHCSMSVCLLVMTVSCAKTAEPIKMSFGVDSRGPTNRVLGGVQIHLPEETLMGGHTWASYACPCMSSQKYFIYRRKHKASVCCLSVRLSVMCSLSTVTQSI